MKIFYSLPQMEHKGDSYIFGVVRIAFWAFLFVSSITVFSGVRAFLATYLTTLPLVVGWVVMLIGFLAFSLAPDFINARIVRYVTRTILQNNFRDARSGVILLFCALLIWKLTSYSYNMSQFAAGTNVEQMAGDAEQIDVAAIDSTFLGRMDQTSAQYQQEKAHIEQRYERLIEEATAQNKAKIAGEEVKIKGLEGNRSKNNTIWTDDQIRIHQRRISSYKDRIAKTAAPLRAQEQQELNELEQRWAAKDSLLTAVYTTARDTSLTANTTRRLKHAQVTAFFRTQLSGIAGYAVFIILILSVITEIIYERNNIEPDPVFTPFDFEPSAFWEALAMPFAYAGRHITNKVREVYNNLPDLVEREDLKRLRDPGRRQSIIREDTDSDSIVDSLSGSMPLGDPQTFYINPDSGGTESAESLESTRKTIESAANIIAILKENRRKIKSYIWKIRNPKSGGKKSTCERNIQRLNQDSLQRIESFYQQIGDDLETRKSFNQDLVKHNIARPGKTILKVIYIDHYMEYKKNL